jgi:hypothetical protein
VEEKECSSHCLGPWLGLWKRAGDSVFEIGPTTGYLHHFIEAHSKNGLVQAICLKVGNIRGKQFNGGRSGYYERM